jgi:hypothetical protein
VSVHADTYSLQEADKGFDSVLQLQGIQQAVLAEVQANNAIIVTLYATVCANDTFDRAVHTMSVSAE